MAQKLDKLGMRGSNTGELVFEDVEIPFDNVLGQEGRGVEVLMSGLDYERVVLAAGPLGIMAACLDAAVPYTRERRQFGQAIGEFQLVQGKLAEMYVTVEAMKSLCYRTLAQANDLGEGDGGRGEIHKVTAAAIMFAAEGCTRVISDAVQIFGGAGYMRETEVNRLYRASKLLEIGAGTTEIRKMIIAGELLRD